MIVDETNTIFYEHIQSGRKTKLRPKNASVHIKPKYSHLDTQNQSNSSKKSVLFSDTEDSDLSEDEKMELKTKEVNNLRAKECSQNKCNCCGKILIY